MKTQMLRSTTLIAALTLIFSAALWAQSPGSGPQPRSGMGPAHGFMHGQPSAEAQLARLAAALDLSDEQATQLLPVLQNAQAQREELREQAMRQMEPQICALMTDTEAAILAILTPEQATQWSFLKQDREQRMQNRRNRNPVPDCSAYQNANG